MKKRVQISARSNSPKSRQKGNIRTKKKHGGLNKPLGALNSSSFVVKRTKKLFGSFRKLRECSAQPKPPKQKKGSKGAGRARQNPYLSVLHNISSNLAEIASLIKDQFLVEFKVNERNKELFEVLGGDEDAKLAQKKDRIIILQAKVIEKMMKSQKALEKRIDSIAQFLTLILPDDLKRQTSLSSKKIRKDKKHQNSKKGKKGNFRQNHSKSKEKDKEGQREVNRHREHHRTVSSVSDFASEKSPLRDPQNNKRREPKRRRSDNRGKSGGRGAQGGHRRLKSHSSKQVVSDKNYYSATCGGGASFKDQGRFNSVTGARKAQNAKKIKKEKKESKKSKIFSRRKKSKDSLNIDNYGADGHNPGLIDIRFDQRRASLVQKGENEDLDIFASKGQKKGLEGISGVHGGNGVGTKSKESFTPNFNNNFSSLNFLENTLQKNIKEDPDETLEVRELPEYSSNQVKGPENAIPVLGNRRCSFGILVQNEANLRNSFGKGGIAVPNNLRNEPRNNGMFLERRKSILSEIEKFEKLNNANDSQSAISDHQSQEDALNGHQESIFVEDQTRNPKIENFENPEIHQKNSSRQTYEDMDDTDDHYYHNNDLKSPRNTFSEPSKSVDFEEQLEVEKWEITPLDISPSNQNNHQYEDYGDSDSHRRMNNRIFHFDFNNKQALSESEAEQSQPSRHNRSQITPLEHQNHPNRQILSEFFQKSADRENDQKVENQTEEDNQAVSRPLKLYLGAGRDKIPIPNIVKREIRNEKSISHKFKFNRKDKLKEMFERRKSSRREREQLREQGMDPHYTQEQFNRRLKQALEKLTIEHYAQDSRGLRPGEDAVGDDGGGREADLGGLEEPYTDFLDECNNGFSHQ